MYDAGQSSTSKDEGGPIELSYGVGLVEGEEYSDDVLLGGYEVAQYLFITLHELIFAFQATDQSFVAASYYSENFSIQEFQPDGLAGFAFEQLSVLNKPSIFETISESGVLPENVFSVKLSSTSGESELYIGGTNTALYVEDTLTYTAVTNEGYWEVNLQSVSRDGATVGSNAASIIDTGTTLIITTNDAAAAYFDGIPGSSESSDGTTTYYTSLSDPLQLLTYD
jgi:cathepsin D